MPKEARPLGKDRPMAQIPGVMHHNSFPKPNLSVGLDEMLAGMDDNAVSDKSGVPQDITDSGAIVVSEFFEIPVSLIDAAPWQPRIYFAPESLARLVESIRARNQVDRALLVRQKDDGRYELIGGERRWRAVKSLDWKTINCRVVSANDTEARLMALSDNEGQEGLTDYERGRAFKELLADGTAESERKLAAKVGVGHMIVNRCLALTKLPPDCIDLLENDPTLLGNTVAPEFYRISLEHPDLVTLAVLKIDQEGMKQEHALKWLRNEVLLATGTQTDSVATVKPRSNERQVSFGNGLSASMSVGKKSIKLTVPDGVKIVDLEKHLLSFFESVKN